MCVLLKFCGDISRYRVVEEVLYNNICFFLNRCFDGSADGAINLISEAGETLIYPKENFIEKKNDQMEEEPVCSCFLMGGIYLLYIHVKCAVK